MGYFPFYIDIKHKNCIVIGGGTVALRKVEKLLPFAPCITVIAPEICDELNRLEEVRIRNRRFEDSDIENAFMVIAATNDEQLNTHIFALCKTKNILINTVDDQKKCGFLFPALVKKENFTIGISTSGKSPVYSRYLRERIEKALDDNCDETAAMLSKYRLLVKSEIKSAENRKYALEQILKICIESAGKVDEGQILNVIEDYK